MNNNLDFNAINSKIEFLEYKQSFEIQSLKTQWNETMQIIKLGKIYQDVVSQLIPNSNSQNSIVKNAIGLSTGYLINKIYPNKPGGLLAKLSKLSFDFIAGKFVASHSHQILNIGMKLLKSIIKK